MSKTSKSEEQSTSGQTSINGKDMSNNDNKSNINSGTNSGQTSNSGTNSGQTSNSGTNSGQTSNSNSSVKQKFRSLSFGRRNKSLNNKCKNNCINSESNCNSKKKKNSGVWAFRLCARTDSCADVSQDDKSCDLCICTAYKRTEEPEVSPINTINVCNASEEDNNKSDPILSNCQMESNQWLTPIPVPQTNDLLSNEESLNEPYVETGLVAYGVNNMDSNVGTYQSSQYATQSMMSEVRSVQVRVSELALAFRSQLAFTVSPYPYLERWGEVAELTPGFLNRYCLNEGQQIHTQIDYIHCLVPDLLQITNCTFYWGKIDRYEAERLLDNKPEGTFLLRDSAQEEHLFSVSFRRFDRSLHARIEQWKHRFSFDSHDPGVYASDTVCGLIEHYKDPSHCMFFEPMLTIPLHRNFTFSLQHLSRASITSCLTYDAIHSIELPKRLKNYLKEYHYKQQVSVRRLDSDH